MTATRTFDALPASVTAARQFVRAALRERFPDAVDAVELMVCELATNSVEHARTGFELVIHDSGPKLRVEVSDADRARPVLRSPTPAQPAGRGLRIVELMSDAWGVIPSPSGKTVWFTVAVQEA